MRLLLLSQDKITQLEEELDQIDSDESSSLFLGCSRLDKNTKRQAVLAKLQEALSVYGKINEKRRKINFMPHHDQSFTTR